MVTGVGVGMAECIVTIPIAQSVSSFPFISRANKVPFHATLDCKLLVFLIRRHVFWSLLETSGVSSPSVRTALRQSVHLE